MKKFVEEYSIYIAWGVSLVAILGSIYFSEIAHFPPCVLCWYQRITIYPQILILGFAIYRKDRNIMLPGFALAAIGWFISLYHNLLYYDIIPEQAAPCIAGASCTTNFVKLFGFMDIPLMSLLSLTAIIVLLFIYWKKSSNQSEV